MLPLFQMKVTIKIIGGGHDPPPVAPLVSATDTTVFTRLHNQKSCISFDILRQAWSTSLYQNAFAWLVTACWWQFCYSMSADLLQVVCYPQACCKLFNKLEQVNKHQVASSLILRTSGPVESTTSCNRLAACYAV